MVAIVGAYSPYLKKKPDLIGKRSLLDRLRLHEQHNWETRVWQSANANWKSDLDLVLVAGSPGASCTQVCAEEHQNFHGTGAPEEQAGNPKEINGEIAMHGGKGTGSMYLHHVRFYFLDNYLV